MREHPDLEQLKRQAKQLVSALKAADSAAVHEVNAHYDSAQAAQSCAASPNTTA